MQHSTMEHLFCFANNHYRLGTTLRYPYLLLLLQGIVALVRRLSYSDVIVSRFMGLPIQQNSEALGSLLPLPSGRDLHSRLHRIRVLPRPHKTLGSLHVERGKLTLCIQGWDNADSPARPLGAVETEQMLTTVCA